MRNRLLLLFVGVVALVLAVHDIPLARHLERVERDRLVTKLERDAFILAGRAEESLEVDSTTDAPLLRSAVARYSVEQNVRVVIVDGAGVAIVASDADALTENFSNRPEVQAALDGEPKTGQRPSEDLGEELFFVAVPVYSGDTVVGAVRVSAPERVVSERTNDRVRGLFLVALISLLIAGAVAWIFSKTVTAPLRRLRSATHDIAAGDLSARAAVDAGPSEVRELGASFNSMAGRLEQLVDRQRAFAGTASHQLRTPLTALRLRLEQIAADPGDEAQTTHSIEAALSETDRLHRMIEGLLALSRAEDAAAGTATVDLSAIARERAEHWRPLADEREVAIVVDVPESASALAVAGAAEQIVDNLIDNALEASPARSTISVAVRPIGQTVEVHVVDEGPGLPDEQRVAAFDRFWRGEHAGTGGSGLGLAIVRQLAQAGGGSAELRPAASGGIDATVTFAT